LLPPFICVQSRAGQMKSISYWKVRLFVTFLLTYHFTKSLAFETEFLYLKVRMLSWIFGFLMEETVVIQKYSYCWSKAAKMLFKRLILFDLPYFVPPWNLPCFHGICVVVTLPKESHYSFLRFSLPESLWKNTFLSEHFLGHHLGVVS